MELLKEKKLSNVILVGEEFFKQNETDFLKFKTTEECKAYLEKQSIRSYWEVRRYSHAQMLRKR